MNDQTPSPAPPTPAQQKPAVPAKHRDVLLTVCALGASAAFMFALLMVRAVPASSAAAAPAAATPGAATKPAGPPPLPGSTWNTDNRSLWIGRNRKGVAFELPADNNVAVWMRTVRPTLIVRCVGGQAEAFVFTDSAATIEQQTEDHTVTFSFDDGPSTTERWPDSSQHDALFAPDGSAFAQRLAGARTLRFGFIPHNASPVTATFSVAGLAPLLAPAVKDCGWKK